ncbi:MAG: hypothetical protein Q7R69_00360 [bacterium]|nr:hypothetical protein [bacterium]
MKYTSIVVGIVITLGLIVGAFFYLPEKRGGDDENRTAGAVRDVPDGWHEYRSERYIFSLLYPAGTIAREFDEGDGAKTFIFENKDEKMGFQIFVVPYGEEKISDKRFLLDVPSGIKQNPSTFYLDGVLATSFYSKSVKLGETWEVWFVHKGFLYEVTALREQESWLSPIIKTWLFL